MGSQEGPKVDVRAIKSYNVHKQCTDKANEMSEKMGERPGMFIGCLPVEHGMIW